MDTILDVLSRGVEQLLGRASGPLHFRLVMTPAVVTALPIRAGLKDARRGGPAFLWTILAKPTERRRLVHSAVQDIGRVFIVACVADTTYQLVVLRAFYPVQLLIVAVACAIVPYVPIRGPITRLARALRKDTAEPSFTSSEDG